MLDIGIKDDVTVLGQGGFGISGDGDDLGSSFFCVREQADHFGGFSRMTESDNEVSN